MTHSRSSLSHASIELFRVIATALSICLAWMVLLGCGSQTTNGGGTDTNTNWVESCTNDEACSTSLECRCGQCTSFCNTDEECSSLGSGARCVAAPTGCNQPNKLCEIDAFFLETSVPPLATMMEPHTTMEPTVNTGPNPESGPGVDESTPIEAGPAPPPEPCLSQCELQQGACDELEFDEFLNFDETQATWYGDGECLILSFVSGECDNDLRFLFYNTGHSMQVHYFDSAGQFVGLGNGTDVGGPPCQGRGYWPEPVRCDAPTVVETYCGTTHAPGDTPDLPWASGTEP